MAKKRGPGGVELGKDGLPLPLRDAAGRFIQTPPEPTLLEKLENAAKQRKLEKFSDESYEWFKSKVRSFGGQKTRDTLLSDAKRVGATKKRISSPGFMYTFVYDAKHKNELPYWDAFPLILLVGPADKGFYGLNLHYLPPKARAVFFDELLKISNSRTYSARTKLQLSYGLLRSSNKYKLFKPAFKRYLTSHVQSPIAFIPSNQWSAALFLPTADFRGASNSKVWSDSILSVK